MDSRQGKSSAVMLLATDQERSVLRRRGGYTPYGFQSSSGGLAFTGEWLEIHTGSYLLGNGYRAFNPVLMRFGGPDSWSPFGKGGINCYAYCGGDPVNRVDPSGHKNIFRRLFMRLTSNRKGTKKWGGEARSEKTMEDRVRKTIHTVEVKDGDNRTLETRAQDKFIVDGNNPDVKFWRDKIADLYPRREYLEGDPKYSRLQAKYLDSYTSHLEQAKKRAMILNPDRPDNFPGWDKRPVAQTYTYQYMVRGWGDEWRVARYHTESTYHPR
ncbi:RHS repeat-associated core domain-containing protein [Pseudomonas sp. R5(2019)]|uniref:RHS repeat-associated core domain-containing protein n=1 Tax=Pseudomonas sp. R5(2019) TaxID=2697566 RepID=UPI0021139E85|nr:RHS repeat-associated core domain-containing protein [Pseudomonas sp. R5(2019)]